MLRFRVQLVQLAPRLFNLEPTCHPTSGQSDNGMVTSQELVLAAKASEPFGKLLDHIFGTVKQVQQRTHESRYFEDLDLTPKRSYYNDAQYDNLSINI